MVSKKLIAILVVFALVAGTAFAVDLGGEVIGVTNVMSKKGAEDDATAFTGPGVQRVRLEGSGDAEIGVGTVGGWVRFDTSWGGTAEAWGLAWWSPIEQLKIQIGADPDGMYDTSHIGRYGFYAQANEIGLVTWDATGSFDNGVFGGSFGFQHFALIIDPIEGLNINVALPLNAQAVDPDEKQISAAFKAALFQVNYSADFGAIHVTYQGRPADYVAGKFWGSVYLGSLVEGLGLELGLGFGFAEENAAKPPLGIALGVRYDSGAFGIKLRSIFEIPMEDGDKTAVRVDVLPSFAISDSVSVFADIGIYLTGADEQFAWHLAPYVRIGPEWGPGFYAGLKFDNGKGTKDVDDKVNIAIPVGIIAKF